MGMFCFLLRLGFVSIGWILLGVAVPFKMSAADWPKWRGPGGDGAWNPRGLPTDIAQREPAQLWSVPVGGGYSGVTTWGDRVYLMDRPEAKADRERLLCVAASSGEVLWQHDWAADYGSMEYATGPRSSVTLHPHADGVTAYALGATGVACALDGATGRVLWQVDSVAELGAKRPTWGFAASPVIDEENVLLHVGAENHGAVVALNRQTGQEVWRGGPDSAGYATPEIIDSAAGRQLIVWGPENLQSLDPASGRTLWTYPYMITYGVSIAQPLFRDGTLLVSGYWHGSKALKFSDSAPTPVLLWENEKEMCGLMSSPLFKDGTVYLLDKNRGLQAIELDTGKILWSDDNTLAKAGRNPQLSLVWMKESEGLAALLNAEGELIYLRLSPSGREELARHQIIGKTWAHPAFAGNVIYARSDTELTAWKLW
jgi:outer membrane protein assembly factor BamB